MTSIVVCGLLLLGVQQGHGQGYHPAVDPVELVTSPRMHDLDEFAAERLPVDLDWRTKDNAHYTTVSRNQHIPQYCGACYAFAATSALSDRIRIARNGTGREINLAMQVVLNCDKVDYGCGGGDAISVYHWIFSHGGIPDETCQPYESNGHDTGRRCHAKDICRVCDEKGCRAAMSYPVYNIMQYGRVRGEYEMMAELQRGPIACEIATPMSFVNWLGWEIYQDETNEKNIDHVISVAGYGVDNGRPYWILRNSWGTYWGYYGWARVAKGVNNIMIEHGCAWAVPSEEGRPMWRHVDAEAVEREEQKDGRIHVHDWGIDASLFVLSMEAETKEPAPTHPEPCRTGKLDWAAVGGELVTGPRPHEEIEEKDVPSIWDWRNVSGQSLVTWNTNENVPHGKCSSCWAQGVAASLGDRIAVQRRGAWPRIGLSPQMLINCKAGGSCNGGDPAGAYAFIREHGITDETCQNYQATEFSCESEYVCRNCAPGGEHGLTWPGKCEAVRNPIIWYVAQYGSVRGVLPMKAEIYKRGPIGCGIDSTRAFQQYSGGVFSEKRDHVSLNRQVSVVGWGTENGKEYWIGRNSVGTYWGESGWFRILMHEDNLGIETDCDWGVPTDASTAPSTQLVARRSEFSWRILALVLGSVATFGVFFLARARESARVSARGIVEDDFFYVRVE